MKTVVSALTGGLLGLLAAFVLDLFLTPAPSFDTNETHWYERSRWPILIAVVFCGVAFGIVRGRSAIASDSKSEN